MNVSDLISYLEQQDPEAEVQIAAQPSWPLAFTVSNVVSDYAILEAQSRSGTGDFEEVPEEEREEALSQWGAELERSRRVVWLATGDHPKDQPYAPKEAWDTDNHWF
jgi:hypothetical protein